MQGPFLGMSMQRVSCTTVVQDNPRAVYKESQARLELVLRF